MSDKKRIAIWSDGACSGNPGPGGWGAVREVADAIRKAQGLGPYLT